MSEAEEPEIGSTNGETEATQAPQEQSASIPKARFDAMLGERNALREEMASIKARLAVQEDPEPKRASGPEVRIPENLTEMQRVEWLVHHFGRKLIEAELGMDLPTVKTLLGTTRTTSEDVAQRRWQDGCRTAGIDPEDKDVQAYVHGCIKGRGQPLDEALKNASRFFGKKPGSDNGIGYEGGAVGVMQAAGLIPKTRNDALEMAGRGQRAKHQTIEEILADKLARP